MVYNKDCLCPNSHLHPLKSRLENIYTNGGIQQTEKNFKKDWDRRKSYALYINEQHSDITIFLIFDRNIR